MPSMAFLRVLQTGTDALDFGVRDLETHVTSAGTILYASTGFGGGVASYFLSNSGAVSLIDTALFDLGGFAGQGAEIEVVDGFLRASSTEITGYDVQFHFQTGPFDTGWNANGSTVRTEVASQSGNTFLPGFNRLDLDLGGFVAPADGFALLFIRPIGSLSGTRYIYGGLALSYLTTD